MSKGRSPQKNGKKKALLTPKEKKTAKQTKKTNTPSGLNFSAGKTL